TIAHVFYRSIIATVKTIAPVAPPPHGVSGQCSVRPVVPGGSMSALFAGLHAGRQYEFRVFDARGVMTGKFAVDASPASRNAIRKALAGIPAMRLVEAKKF
ncbi:MAG: hypothetical protein JXA71_06070, partial [Chitinispirillaceae bacterium]|nr:hypothetical protein [Chitinispirillaceae bacterium]